MKKLKTTTEKLREQLGIVWTKLVRTSSERFLALRKKKAGRGPQEVGDVDKQKVAETFLFRLLSYKFIFFYLSSPQIETVLGRLKLKVHIIPGRFGNIFERYFPNLIDIGIT